jgi:hypothetical protein
MQPFLSKSDFKVAQDCATKLYYKKNKYPSLKESNEYLQLLADGGYMIGKMAQLIYPEGIEIAGKTDDCIKATEDYLAQDNCVLFEPAIYINNKLIRIDILIKSGNSFELIEVKSKSYNNDALLLAQQKNKKYFDSDWAPYLEDVTYQKIVLQEKFPQSKIDAYLLLPDQAKTTPIDGLIRWFQLKEVQQTATFRSVDVDFVGDEEQLRAGHILSKVDVNSEVLKLENEIKQRVNNTFIPAVLENKRIETALNYDCRNCEYKVKNKDFEKSGFDICWGSLSLATNNKGEVVPHILELGQIGNINRLTNQVGCIDKLIEQGKVVLKEIPTNLLYKKDGEPAYNGRPLYQITKEEEFLLPEFQSAIRDIKYPLYFIDFETSQMAIPYHANMRPYEKVLFQWSCHIIRKPGAELEHYEWINTEALYPNIEFAKSLKNLIGFEGTVLTWSSYENTQLKLLINIVEETELDEPELLRWLKHIAMLEKDGLTMILDMNMLALKYYFHPLMGGRTSIKVTLPAVLQSTTSTKIRNWLIGENLFGSTENNAIINPYDLLPKIDIMEKAESVKDGSGAMRAYQDMLYGAYYDNAEIKQQYRDALLKYCKLDTLAMVIIWEHWITMNNNSLY